VIVQFPVLLRSKNQWRFRFLTIKPIIVPKDTVFHI